MKIKKLIIFPILALTLFSCSKKKDEPVETKTIQQVDEKTLSNESSDVSSNIEENNSTEENSYEESQSDENYDSNSTKDDILNNN